MQSTCSAWLHGVDGWMGACNVELMSGQWGQCWELVEVKCRIKSADKEWFEQMSAWVNGKVNVYVHEWGIFVGWLSKKVMCNWMTVRVK